MKKVAEVHFGDFFRDDPGLGAISKGFFVNVDFGREREREKERKYKH